MSEILILIHGNRFLMNKIRIRLLQTKNPALTDDIQIFTYVNFTIVKYLLVLILLYNSMFHLE